MTRAPKKKIKRRKPKKPNKFLEHMKSIGATNRLAVYLVIMLLFGLVMGFVLAVMSIHSDYAGSLICFTVVFTPMGTAISIVLNSIVNKSKAENTGADGEGIKYALAMNELLEESESQEPEIIEDEPEPDPVDTSDASENSPPI